MNAKITLLSLGLLLAGRAAQAQLVVTAPVLEVQSGVQTGLQNTMKTLSAAANRLVANGVQEQQLTKVFAEKNLLLAKNWYDGLAQVSAAVRDYRRVKLVFQKQGQIISEYASAVEVLRKSPFIEPQQLAEITKIYGKLLAESGNTLADLQTVVSPALFKMTDAERLRFIDALDAKMSDQVALVHYFTQRNLAMMRVAQQDAVDTKSISALVGAKK